MEYTAVTMPAQGILYGETDVYTKRRTHMMNVCQSLSPMQVAYPPINPVIAIDAKHNFLFCLIAKCASASWKQIFRQLGNGSPQMKNITLLKFHEMSRNINHVFTDYVKVVMVRHPFERFLSAYLNIVLAKLSIKRKLQNPSAMHRHITNMRTMFSLSESQAVTFSHFVDYVLNTGAFNRHWAPYHTLCSPCKIHYDVIGKMETISSDVDFILRSVGMNGSVFPTALSRHRTQSSRRAKLRKYYNRLSKDQINGLYEKYSVDFHLFGYEYPSWYGI
uniref:Carbohydrate sulfotransferase n=1 Tax=Saccoglossus kowalevskii TaxID=10224 RepID=A0ABM0M818_SACKO|nr:PREDICTED: carbohydrate sulfotransferase 11-like [Saccoglossus kowalevskii]